MNTSIMLWSVLGSASIFKLCVCVYVGHAGEKNESCELLAKSCVLEQVELVEPC